MDYSGYPVIAANNYSLPPFYSHERVTKIFIKDDTQNKKEIYLNISSPFAGQWFASSFIDSQNKAIKPDVFFFYLLNKAELFAYATIRL